MSPRKRTVAIVLVLLLSLAAATGSGAGHPARALQGASAEQAGTTIPYAGRLNDKAGQPVPDGAYDLLFALYGTATGGDRIWSETQRGVVVANGQFLTTLGSVAPIPATALGGRNGWLAVSVRGPGEAGFTALSPRQLVSAAAPAATTAGAACPHDHLGEWWTGDPGTGNNGLRIESTRTDSSGITGVAHTGTNSTGVFGWTTEGTGVWGSSGSGTGVNGTGAIGVHGKGNYGVYGETDSGYAGVFAGDVSVLGTLSKFAGSFKIDHPLDPANKYLYHSFVESPDMKNIYDGVVTLDTNGKAIVELPDWFAALNGDFRYQLTCVGGFAPVYIAEEIADNRFTIAGGIPGLKVSWQVTGIRQDPYAEQHRIPVEEDKPLEERGTYLYPEGYGQPATMRPNILPRPLEEAQP